MERSGDTGGHRAMAAGTRRAPGCEPRDRYHHAHDAVGAGVSRACAPGGATRVPRTRSDDGE